MIRSTDITLAAALKLRKALLNQDFQLNNEFCDSYELVHAWRNANIPDSKLKKISPLKNCHDRE